MLGAVKPYSRRRIVYKVGPLRYSFQRLQREYGRADQFDDASCKAVFRFNFKDLVRLYEALRFPEKIDTRATRR